MTRGNLDNGGSPAVSLFRPGVGLRALVESYYHRTRAIAVAAYALKGEPEVRFSSQRRLFLPIRLLRAAKKVGLTFAKEVGPVRENLTFP